MAPALWLHNYCTVKLIAQLLTLNTLLNISTQVYSPYCSAYISYGADMENSPFYSCVLGCQAFEQE